MESLKKSHFFRVSLGLYLFSSVSVSNNHPFTLKSSGLDSNFLVIVININYICISICIYFSFGGGTNSDINSREFGAPVVQLAEGTSLMPTTDSPLMSQLLKL